MARKGGLEDFRSLAPCLKWSWKIVFSCWHDDSHAEGAACLAIPLWLWQGKLGRSTTTHVDQRIYQLESANRRIRLLGVHGDQQSKSFCGLVCAVESHTAFSRSCFHACNDSLPRIFQYISINMSSCHSGYQQFRYHFVAWDPMSHGSTPCMTSMFSLADVRTSAAFITPSFGSQDTTGWKPQSQPPTYPCQIPTKPTRTSHGPSTHGCSASSSESQVLCSLSFLRTLCQRWRQGIPQPSTAAHQHRGPLFAPAARATVAHAGPRSGGAGGTPLLVACRELALVQPAGNGSRHGASAARPAQRPRGRVSVVAGESTTIEAHGGTHGATHGATTTTRSITSSITSGIPSCITRGITSKNASWSGEWCSAIVWLVSFGKYRGLGCRATKSWHNYLIYVAVTFIKIIQHHHRHKHQHHHHKHSVTTISNMIIVYNDHRDFITCFLHDHYIIVLFILSSQVTQQPSLPKDGDSHHLQGFVGDLDCSLFRLPPWGSLVVQTPLFHRQVWMPLRLCES